MSLSPFTPAGVQDKLNEIYALPDPQLALESYAIKLDFRKWMKDNFVLSPDQVIFLDNMNNSAIDYYGEQCSLCFSHRLAITLNYPPAPELPNISKWPEATNSLLVATDGAGNLKVSGSLTFTMVYTTEV